MSHVEQDFQDVEQDVFITVNLNNKIPKIIEEKDPLKMYKKIENKYLKFFYGTWVKYINKTTKEYCSGGILTEMNFTYNTIFLRTLKPANNSNTIRVYPYTDYIFYVKYDTENYRAYEYIYKELNYIKHEKQKLKQMQQQE